MGRDRAQTAAEGGQYSALSGRVHPPQSFTASRASGRTFLVSTQPLKFDLTHIPENCPSGSYAVDITSVSNLFPNPARSMSAQEQCLAAPVTVGNSAAADSVP